MAEENEPIAYARKSCLPCRQSKRRCDRKLPGCDLCIRKEVDCCYPSRRPAGHQSPAGQSSQSVARNGNSPAHDHDQRGLSGPLGPPGSVESDANAVYFVAPHIFQQARLEFPRTELPIPPEVSAILGDAAAIRDISTKFFRTVHRWLPIVSKKGFFAYLLNPLARRQTGLSLLALCMKLCCTPPPEGDNDIHDAGNLYRAAKRFHHEAETAGALSIHTLQAGIMIALYELAQAIYPAAYLSVGACARYGLALGVNDLSTGWSGDGGGPRSWTEVEERRRAWWAVLMFDRFLSLSNPARPLSTEDPSFEAFLPVDDAPWDDWSNPGNGVRISTGFTLNMGSFARLAQATYLLSQALRTISPRSGEECSVSQPVETAQLRRTLLALVHAADSEATIRKLEYCAPSALSLSTILLLEQYNPHCVHPGVEDGHSSMSFETLWPESRTALDRLTAAAESYLTTCRTIPDAPHIVPISILHVIYQSACLLLRVSQAPPDADVRGKIATLRLLLGRIAPRWRLAGVYLYVLEAREIVISADSIETQLGFVPARFDPFPVPPQTDFPTGTRSHA